MEFNSSGEMKVKCSKIKAAVRSSACSQRSSGRSMDDLQDLRSSRANHSTEVSVTENVTLCLFSMDFTYETAHGRVCCV